MGSRSAMGGTGAVGPWVEKTNLAACLTKCGLHSGTAGEKDCLWVKKDQIMSNPNVGSGAQPLPHRFPAPL